MSPVSSQARFCVLDLRACSGRSRLRTAVALPADGVELVRCPDSSQTMVSVLVERQENLVQQRTR